MHPRDLLTVEWERWRALYPPLNISREAALASFNAREFNAAGVEYVTPPALGVLSYTWAQAFRYGEFITHAQLDARGLV